MARRVTQRRAGRGGSRRGPLTAFGHWAKAQKYGALKAVERDTGVAYSTVHEAQWRHVTDSVADLLAEVSKRRKSRDGAFEYVLGHSFDADAMKMPPPASRARRAVRKREAA